MKKFLTPLLSLCFAAALFSCGNSDEKKDDPAKSADTTATAAPTAPPAFTPFDVVEITHTVKDYAKWRPLFNSDSTARKTSGMEDLAVGRGLEKNNDILVVLKASDVQKAKAFGSDPRLKAAMDKAGVISKPEMEYFHVIRFNPNSNEKQWVVVTHKVKDFDAWLKVFDAEGTATRATYGLVDVALARGIDDSSVVHIVFDIKDMTKAKARINDPALKKLMTDGGVIGAPKIKFYTDAE
jgi:hypothetical protein